MYQFYSLLMNHSYHFQWVAEYLGFRMRGQGEVGGFMTEWPRVGVCNIYVYVCAWFLHDVHMTMHLKFRLFSDVFETFGLFKSENHFLRDCKQTPDQARHQLFDAPSTIHGCACTRCINSNPFFGKNEASSIKNGARWSFKLVVYAESKCDCIP